MRVEFVCNGNTFRSRIAEAYLKSKKLPGIEVSSSGVLAESNRDGPITWWGQRIIKNAGLISYESRDWRRTTTDILSQTDLVIFFGSSPYDYCRSKLHFSKKHEVWDISDVDLKLIHPGTEAQLCSLCDDIFKQIRDEVDKLAEILK